MLSDTDKKYYLERVGFEVIRRGTLEILFSILDACERKTVYTRILGYTNTNWKMAKQRLDLLSDHGYLELKPNLDDARSLGYYQTTTKGLLLLKTVKELRNAITSSGELP